MHQQQQTEAEAAAEEKEKERKTKKYMFVCMFYLSPRSRIIVSVPGNIRNSKQNKAKQNKKKEGEKERSGEEQKFSLFVTNKMRMFFFCFFFLVLYFI